jgi:hypothetical protein
MKKASKAGPEMNGAVFPLLPCVRGFENPLPVFMMICVNMDENLHQNGYCQGGWIG